MNTWTLFSGKSDFLPCHAGVESEWSRPYNLTLRDSNSKTSISPSSGCVDNAKLSFDIKCKDSEAVKQKASKTRSFAKNVVTKTPVAAYPNKN